MSLAVNEFQRALYARLASQLPASTKVYDFVPQDAAFPYVVIGQMTSLADDTKTEEGQQLTCTLHAWNAPNSGRKATNAVMQAIYAALHRQEETLTLTGFTLTELVCEFTETFQETAIEGASDRYYHGVMRFRAIVESNS